MSDCEDFFLDWISPGKRKRKKNLNEKKMGVKNKNNITIKTDEKIQKKKKKKKKINSKFKEALGEKKKKMKEKKKKKLNDSGSGLLKKSKSLALHSTDHLTQDSKKKTKRTKKVAFDLSPATISAKRPKIVSSSLEVKIFPEKEAVTDISCSQVSQAQSNDIDSQCTSDDINSQDLFITQKTFRTFSSEPSSGEANDKAVDTTSQQTVTQREGVHNSLVKIKYVGGSNTHLQVAHFPMHHKNVEQSLFKEKETLILEEQDVFEQSLKKQMELNTNRTGKKKVYGVVPVKLGTVNPYLDNAVVVKCSLDGTSTSSQECPSCPPNTNRHVLSLQTTTASISTQTENFFTANFSSYLSFSHKNKFLETLQPLDLSLPHRARKDLERCFSEKNEVKVDKKKLSEQKVSSVTGDMKGSSGRHTSLHPCSFSEKKVEDLKEPAVRQLWCVNTQHKGQIVRSPKSESEPKSVDPTSSEDSEPACRTGKVDLTQVRAVQMRLNESFFFKAKGDRHSPRAESPLMKLVQSREMKSRKCH